MSLRPDGSNVTVAVQVAPPARNVGQLVLAMPNLEAFVPPVLTLSSVVLCVPVLVMVTCWVPVSPGA